MGKKVLLADDSATIQKLVEMALSDTEYELCSVSDGKQAIDMIPEFQPDIILADAIMPSVDGYGVCEFVKNDPNFAGIPVILLTGRFQPFDNARAEAVKIDERIVKPFSQDQLVSMISGLLERTAQAATPFVEEDEDQDFLEETVHVDSADELEVLDPVDDSLDEDFELEEITDEAEVVSDANATVQYSQDMLEAMARSQDGDEEEEEEELPSLGDFDLSDDDEALSDDHIEALDEDDASWQEDPVQEPAPLDDPEVEVQAEDDFPEDEDESEHDVTMELTSDDLAEIDGYDLDDELAVPEEDAEDSLSISDDMPDFANASADLEDELNLVGEDQLEELDEDSGDFASTFESDDRDDDEPIEFASEDSSDEEAPEEGFSMDSATEPPMDLDDDVMDLDDDNFDLEESVGVETQPYSLASQADSPDFSQDFDEDSSDLPDAFDDSAEFEELNDDDGPAEADDMSEEDFRNALGEEETGPNEPADLDDTDDLEAPSMDELDIQEIDQPLLDDEPELALDTEPMDTPLADALMESDLLPDSFDDDSLDLGDEDSFETEPVNPLQDDSNHEELLIEEDPLRLEDEGDPFVSDSPTLDLEEPVLEEVNQGFNHSDDAILEVDQEPEPEEAPTQPLPQMPPVQAAQAPVAASGTVCLDDAQLDILAEKVAARIMAQLGQEAIRDVVWEVVPELAEAMIKKRIYQLEQSSDED